MAEQLSDLEHLIPSKRELIFVLKTPVVQALQWEMLAFAALQLHCLTLVMFQRHLVFFLVVNHVFM